MEEDPRPDPETEERSGYERYTGFKRRQYMRHDITLKTQKLLAPETLNDRKQKRNKLLDKFIQRTNRNKQLQNDRVEREQQWNNRMEEKELQRLAQIESRIFQKGEKEVQKHRDRDISFIEGKDKVYTNNLEQFDINQESKFWEKSYAAFRKSPELQESYSEKELVKKRLQLDELDTFYQSKLEPIRRSEAFRQKLLATIEAEKVITKEAEKAAATTFNKLEKLRRNNKQTFEQKALARRVYLEKKAESEELLLKAQKAKSDVETMKQHIIQDGLTPDLYAQNVAAAAAAAKQRQQDGAPSPRSREKHIGSLHSDSDWNGLVKQGLNYSRMDQLDKEQHKRVRLESLGLAQQHQDKRLHDSSADSSGAEEWELQARDDQLQPNVYLQQPDSMHSHARAKTNKTKHFRQISSPNSSCTSPQSPSHTKEASISSSLHSDGVHAEPSVASVVSVPLSTTSSALPPHSVSPQSSLQSHISKPKTVHSVPSLLSTQMQRRALASSPDPDAAEPLIRGVLPWQVPPLCRQWGIRKCHLPSDECKGRHFYVSVEEQKRWENKRLALDSNFEKDVLNFITEREALIDAIQRECETSRQRFESNTSSFVKLNDVQPLIYLLNQMRVATVNCVEAVVKWRNHVSKTYDLSLLSQSAARGLAASGWVVKVSVVGKQLFPGSKGFRSQIKRFCRDTDPTGKKELNFKYLGVYPSQMEALVAFNAANARAAIEQNVSSSRLPPPRFVVRSCGKHYAVESDVGLAATRCEICHVESYDGASEYTPAFLWNGVNYLLKIIQDLDFLQHKAILRDFLGSDFPFKRNPLLLASGLSGKGVASQELALSTDLKTSFGKYTTTVLKYKNGVKEWFGHVSTEDKFQVGMQAAYVPQMVTDRRLVDEFIDMHRGREVTVLDAVRVSDAQRVLLAEEDIAKYMHLSKLATKRSKLKRRLRVERQARRHMRQQRRDAGEAAVSEDSSEAEASSSSDGEGAAQLLAESTEASEAEEDHLFTYDSDGNEVRVAQATRDAPPVPSEATHTVYYYDKGEFLAVRQPRHSAVGVKPGVWCNPEEGSKWHNLTTRGKHSKHYEFQENLKRQGQDRQRVRRRVQRKLKRAMHGDGSKVDVRLIQHLINHGKQVGGSLVLMDCSLAEQFLEHYHQRVASAVEVQRFYRSFRARVLVFQLKQQIGRVAQATLESNRLCSSTARAKVSQWFSAAAKRAGRKVKTPVLVKMAMRLGGEVCAVKVDATDRRQRYHALPRLVEPCLVCLGQYRRRRVRHDLSHLTVRERRCEVEHDAIRAGVIRLRRFEETVHTGPCYCKRALPEREQLLVTAYDSQNCREYQLLLDESRIRSCILADLQNPASASVSDEFDNQLCLRLSRLQGVPTDAAFGHCLSGDGFDPHWPRHATAKPRTGLNLVREATALARRSDSLRRCRDNLQRALEVHRGKIAALETETAFKVELFHQASEEYRRARRLMFASQLHYRAMIHAADKALGFSKAQVELYKDLQASSNQQAWDPFEKADNGLYIQRKWQARKALMFAKTECETKRIALFQALSNKNQSLFLLQQAKQELQLRLTKRDQIQQLHATSYAHWQQAEHSKTHMLLKLLSLLTVRLYDDLHMQPRLVIRRPQWFTPTDSLTERLQPSVLNGWNVLSKLGKRLSIYNNLHQLQSLQYDVILDVKEDVYHVNYTFALPLPHAQLSRFAVGQTVAATDACLYLAPSHTVDHHYNTLHPRRAVNLTQALMQLREAGCDANPGGGESLYNLDYDLQQAVLQPPYLGVLRLSAFCVRLGTSVVFVLNPIEIRELLLLQAKPMEQDLAANAALFLAPAGDLHRCRTQYEQRLVLQQHRDRAVQALIRLVHVKYDEITSQHSVRLGNLKFLRLRRELFNKLFTTQWWKDVKSGKTSMKGSLVFHEGRKICSYYSVVKIFENYGDLTFEFLIKDMRHRKYYTARMFLSEMFVYASFEESPVLLNFWRQSVKINRYSYKLLRKLIDRLKFKVDIDQLRAANTKPTKGRVYTGVSVPHTFGAVRRQRTEFLDTNHPFLVSVRRQHQQRQDGQGPACKTAFDYLQYQSSEPLLLLCYSSQDMYQLLRRRSLLVSSYRMVVSGYRTYRGDLRVTAYHATSTASSLHDRDHNGQGNPSIHFVDSSLKDANQQKANGLLQINLSRHQILMFLSKEKRLDLMKRASYAEVVELLCNYLAVRLVKRPEYRICDHPYFQPYYQLYKYGIHLDAIALLLKQHKQDEHFQSMILHRDHLDVVDEEYYLPSNYINELVLSRLKPEEHYTVIYRGLIQTKLKQHLFLELLQSNGNLIIKVRRETRLEQDRRREAMHQEQMQQEDRLSRLAREETRRMLEARTYQRHVSRHLQRRNYKSSEKRRQQRRLDNSRRFLDHHFQQLRHRLVNELRFVDGQLALPEDIIVSVPSVSHGPTSIRTGIQQYSEADGCHVRLFRGLKRFGRHVLLLTLSSPCEQQQERYVLQAYHPPTRQTHELVVDKAAQLPDASYLQQQKKALVQSSSDGGTRQLVVRRRSSVLSSVALEPVAASSDEAAVLFQDGDRHLNEKIEALLSRSSDGGEARSVATSPYHCPRVLNHNISSNAALVEARRRLRTTQLPVPGLRAYSSNELWLRWWRKEEARASAGLAVASHSANDAVASKLTSGSSDERERATWLKFGRAADLNEKQNSTNLFQELFSRRAVGLGPLAGGCTPERDAEAAQYAKHEMRLSATELASFVACSKDSLSDTGAANYLLSASAMSVTNLVTWVTQHVEVQQGAECFGRDDRLVLDRTVFNRGTLSSYRLCGGTSSGNDARFGRRGLMTRAVVTDDEKYIEFQAHDPAACQVAPQRLRVSNLTQYPHVRKVVAEYRAAKQAQQLDILDPRMRRELCKLLSDRLVLRYRNEVSTIEDKDTPWVVNQLKWEKHRQFRLAASKQKQAKQRQVDLFLSNQVRLCRLEVYRRNLIRQRHRRQMDELHVASQEWTGMIDEDQYAYTLRNYLTCDHSLIVRMREVFDEFDADGSGTISVDEFQAFVFDIGQVMTEVQVKQAISSIDMDASGFIDFDEFAIWWLATAKDKFDDNSKALKMLRTKLTMKRKIRQGRKSVVDMKRRISLRAVEMISHKQSVKVHLAKKSRNVLKSLVASSHLPRPVRKLLATVLTPHSKVIGMLQQRKEREHRKLLLAELQAKKEQETKELAKKQLEDRLAAEQHQIEKKKTRDKIALSKANEKARLRNEKRELALKRKEEEALLAQQAKQAALEAQKLAEAEQELARQQSRKEEEDVAKDKLRQEFIERKRSEMGPSTDKTPQQLADEQLELQAAIEAEERRLEKERQRQEQEAAIAERQRKADETERKLNERMKKLEAVTSRTSAAGRKEEELKERKARERRMKRQQKLSKKKS